MRRNAVNRFFSKSSITKIESQIHDLANKLCDKILKRAAMGKIFDATDAYSCFSSDVITSYCFGQTHGFLDQEDFVPNLKSAIRAGASSMAVVKQFPFLATLVENMPE
jgi:cytochrome P450